MSAIRAGYKQTEVGVIPEDWECTSVNSLAASVRNAIVGGPFGSDLVSRDYVDDGVPVIRGQNMGWKCIEGPYAFVTEQKAASLEANLARPGDVVFTQRGTLGQVSVVPEAPYNLYLVSQSQMKISLNRGLVSPNYFHCWFSSEGGQESIRLNTIQTGVPHINLGILRSLQVPLPTIPEQEAIAEALSDADALIESLEQLLAKKRYLKQGAMLELLTGKKRLPGFSGEWEESQLGDAIEKFVGGGTPSRTNSQYWGDEIPWVTVKDFATFNPLHSQEAITKAGLHNSASHLIPKGTLITSTRMALGKAVIYEVDVAINQDLKALFPRQALNARYLYFWFEYHGNSIDELGSGSTVKGISLPDLKKIQFRLPPKPEQIAIVTILSEMDAEIAEVDAQLAKTRALKQGMMQKLLTGEIRLK